MRLKRTPFCVTPEPRVQDNEGEWRQESPIGDFNFLPQFSLTQGVPNTYSCFSLSPFPLPPLLPAVSFFPPSDLVAADWEWEEPVFQLRKVHENNGEMAENDS